ncbi:midkine b isoform X2 [Pseudoliparis swirei]|nr:midkine b isoform X2 [Pseudoliparis swirei]
MQSVFSVTLLLLLALALPAEATRKAKAHRGEKQDQTRPASECSAAETQYGKCVPEHGDCGAGLRESTCRDLTEQIHCKVPCNWKKDISDCKYKFGSWGSCDSETSTKTRSGSLKRVLFNADCQTTVTVSKPCSPRAKKSRGKKTN